MDIARFPQLIRDIYRTVEELEAMFPGRHFTPDGHMVGSIGEAIAKHYYGVNLYSASYEGHDGNIGARQVQVKATQRSGIDISSEPQYLLVFRLLPDGTFVEEYNGPGKLVWRLISHKPLPKNGQYRVSLSTLRKLLGEFSTDEVLPRIVA